MRFFRFLSIAAFCLALTVPPVAAQPVDPRRAVQQGQALPLGVILQRTMPSVPGRLLKADLLHDQNRQLVYRLRILQDSGNLVTVTLDARTGTLLGMRGNR